MFQLSLYGNRWFTRRLTIILQYTILHCSLALFCSIYVNWHYLNLVMLVHLILLFHSVLIVLMLSIWQVLFTIFFRANFGLIKMHVG